MCWSVLTHVFKHITSFLLLWQFCEMGVFSYTLPLPGCLFTWIGSICYVGQYDLIALIWSSVTLCMLPCQLLRQGYTAWRNPGMWWMTSYALCPKPGIPILEIEHDKGKCTLFYFCFGHYRMLAYTISACEICIIWRKPTEAFQNPLSIAESRTGKPAMVTLKIHLNCSMVHDTTLWVNIYVRSHLGCGTDSVFIGLTNISKTQKRCK